MYVGIENSKTNQDKNDATVATFTPTSCGHFGNHAACVSLYVHRKILEGSGLGSAQGVETILSINIPEQTNDDVHEQPSTCLN